MKRADIVEQIRVALGTALGREIADLPENTSLFETWLWIPPVRWNCC
ncbi:hypothetical protein ACFXKC_42265 [Streptomyces sp. NPDC059340]